MTSQRALLPRVHFTAPAGSCRDDIRRLGFKDSREYLAFVRANLDRGLHFTADRRLFEAAERPEDGGRADDEARIRDVQGALGDRRTRAIVFARGGSWFSRIVGRLDFGPLRVRHASDPLWAFGFSEITSLVNFVASYPAGRGVYWLCPNYLGWKVGPKSPARNAVGRRAFAEFWRLLPGVISAGSAESATTRGEDAPPSVSPVAAALASAIAGRIVSGRVKSGEIRIIGGCLSVLAATLPGPLARRLRPDGKWLLIEDIHEAPHRIDRQLAPLGLLGWFERLSGVLVGDFHSQQRDEQQAAVAVLRRHLSRNTPIVVTGSVGHVWPMTPVLLNRPLRMVVQGDAVNILSFSRPDRDART